MTTLFGSEVDRSAVFSEDRTYRYTLERYWDYCPRHVLFILLNPSTADAKHDDPTNRRGIGFARHWGFGGVVFVNLFACRTPKPSEMKKQNNPVGPDNDMHIIQQAKRVRDVVLAWGTHGDHLNRNKEVVDMLLGAIPKHHLWHLGLTRNGHPKHPLYLRRDAKLQKFRGSVL